MTKELFESEVFGRLRGHEQEAVVKLATEMASTLSRICFETKDIDGSYLNMSVPEFQEVLKLSTKHVNKILRKLTEQADKKSQANEKIRQQNRKLELEVELATKPLSQ
jgi:hypothetical protein